MKRVFFVGIALVAFSMSSFVTIVSVMAESSGHDPAKTHGDYNTIYWGLCAGRSIQHARDYSRGYQLYTRQVLHVLPEIARQEAAGVGQNIASAQKQFKELRKGTTDPEILKSLEIIDKQLADAVQAHELMSDLCMIQIIDRIGTTKCCEDIEASLAKAFAEYQKIMKRLEGESATAASN